MRTSVTNATVLDTSSMTYSEGEWIVIEDGVIVDVGNAQVGDSEVTVDAAGRFVVPGLIDAHLDGSTDEIVDLIALVQAARSPAPYQTSCSCLEGE